MTTTDRKPCPFCGADSGRLYTTNDGTEFVECTTLECGAEGPHGGWESWNRRLTGRVIKLPDSDWEALNERMPPELRADPQVPEHGRIILNKDRWEP